MPEAYRGIQPDDFGIQDAGARQALFVLNNELRRAFKEVKKQSEPDNITVTVNNTTSSVADALRRSSVPIGAILWMYISWAEATRLATIGWYICDGDNGTPPLVNRRNSTVTQRFIRSVKRGDDPWVKNPANPRTGGSSTVTISDHTIGAKTHSSEGVNINDHDAHSHQLLVYGEPGSTVDVVTNEPDGVAMEAGGTSSGISETVSLSSHVAQAHSHTAHTADTLSHTADATPPYVECIPLMKVR